MSSRRCLYAVSVLVLGLGLILSGCAATTTALRYKDLDVQTKMTATIFLDPVSPDKRTIFIQVRNTTDKPMLDIEPQVAGAISAKGYTVVQDPAKAHYILQANVLQVGKTDQSALERSTAAGFGGVAGGIALGAVLGGDRAGTGAAVGGVAAGAAEAISGSLVKVVWYSMITDIQLSERVGGAVSQEFKSRLKQGTADTTTTQTTASTTNLKRYQTRIVSSARQVNLEFQEALPHLKQGLITSVSGLF
jgi:flagellar hook-basal body complex protein FliE